MGSVEVELQGRSYGWDGSRWTDSRFLRPPTRIRAQLMQELVRAVESAPAGEMDIELALRVASACADEGMLAASRRLAERALQDNPEDARAATLLAQTLRRLRQPRRALRVTRPFAKARDAELQTARAAAFADIGKWEAADRAVRRAVALQKREISAETTKVLARVLAANVRSAA